MTAGVLVGDAEPGIDNGLRQGGAVNPGGVEHHVRLPWVEGYFDALHARQGRQYPLHTVDATAAGHAGYGQDDFVHADPRKKFQTRFYSS